MTSDFDNQKHDSDTSLASDRTTQKTTSFDSQKCTSATSEPSRHSTAELIAWLESEKYTLDVENRQQREKGILSESALTRNADIQQIQDRLAEMEADKSPMKITRTWAMPNQWTFTILPIKRLLRELTKDYSNWVDPFAGMNSPCGLTNDLRESMPATHHMCALEFLRSLPSDTYDGVLYDPPYSISQAKECYEGAGMKNLAGSMRWWADVKDEIARIIKPGGTAVCFGWSTNGVGINRGFTMREVLIVPHGGSKNDTLVTVETKTGKPQALQPTSSATQNSHSHSSFATVGPKEAE